MHIYNIYGLLFSSDIELPSAYEITQAENTDSKVMILKQKKLQMLYEKASGAAQEYIKTEQNITCLTEKEDEMETIIHVLGIGSFRITDGKTIEYFKPEETDIYQFEQWMLNMAVSTCIIQQGGIILHGSALKYNDGLVIISGESGSGKSTLTDVLLGDDRFKFASDDSVLLECGNEHIYGYGAYPLRRLCDDVVQNNKYDTEKLIYIPDNGREKYGLIMKENYSPDAVRTDYLFILETGKQEEVSITEVTGSGKLGCILRSLYKNESYKRFGLTQDMMIQCLKIAGKLKIYNIIRPEKGMTGNMQRDKIFEVLNITG